MFRQYKAHRFCGGNNPHRIGTIPCGAILYIQDARPLSGLRGPFVCREPWIVEAWHNREYFPAVKGAPAVTYCTGGHLATVRSLRTGKRRQVADWLLLAAADAGLERL
jgi:hypothetical protein